MMRVLRFLLLLLAVAAPAAAHEVRPAYLQIDQGADGRVDVLWKQPTAGELAVALRPRIAGGVIDRAPDSTAGAGNFQIARWHGLTLKGGSLDGREVRIEGLDRTITDTLVHIHFRNGDETQQMLTPGDPAFTVDAHAGAAVTTYLWLGIKHILTGIDHLLFVLGLLLLSSNWRQLTRTITAFTVAHSITLALTALKVMTINPALVEAMVAYSILFLAVELVRKQRGADGITQRQPWLIAFGFGLLHGAAFAGALKEIGLPEHNIPGALFLFNLGVEVGQLLFVAAVGSVLWALRHVRWPRQTGRLAWTTTSYAIGSFSMFWFLERLHAALQFT
jgi:hydrogenase/urease accessory protein HupE